MVSRVDRRRSGVGRRGELLLAAAVFVTVLLGALGVVRTLPTAYAASSVVSFLPRPDALLGADTVQLVGQKYAVLATSPDVLRSAAAVTGDRPEDLRTATTAVLAEGTGNLRITATLADADRAARAANAVADVLIRASGRDQLVAAELTSRAIGQDAEVRPARMLLRGVGVLAAALAAALAWSLVAGVRRRGRDELAAGNW
jgi:hypothetical protein